MARSERGTATGRFALSQTTTWWLSILTLLMLATWMWLGIHFWQPETAEAPGAAAASVGGAELPPADATGSLGSGEVVEGPWGRLEMVPITISPPPEFVVEGGEDDREEVVWHFVNVSPARLSDQLLELGLPDSLVVRLRAATKLNHTIGGCSVFPDRELVLGLSPEVRRKLYVFLHSFRENEDQCNGFQFCGESMDSWIGDSPLLPETRDLITPLIYRQGGFLFFSDLRSVLPLLPSEAERRRLILTMTREATLLLRLKISPDSDLDALADYWGRGGRAKEVRPILESLARLGGEQSLDVTHLLPPFARQRLYTYPVLPGTIPDSSHDCHWTALNFFREQPDERFGKVQTAFDTFGQDYYRIFRNPQFGDLVVYVDHEDRTIHSAVYIAADVVFTKNGSTILRPWMFMKLDDMDQFYPRPRRQELTRAFFRRKGM
ncbi:MAG: hypothetical protein JXB62_02625 [Pirellulales bacterium]|nr:hypothetical protein [Pirellulales bacterium]